MADIEHAGLDEARRLAEGGVPDPDELAAAPLLRGWIVEPMGDGLIRLSGYVTGHPTLHDGWCHTSAVLVVDPDKQWVRTVNRYYRLQMKGIR